MSAAEFSIGNKTRLTAVFKNVETGDNLDPDEVQFHYRRPGGTRITFEYGTDAELVKDEEGVYHVDLSLDKKGEWNYRWQSTGDGQAAKDDSLIVLGTVV